MLSELSLKGVNQEKNRGGRYLKYCILKDTRFESSETTMGNTDNRQREKARDISKTHDRVFMGRF